MQLYLICISPNGTVHNDYIKWLKENKSIKSSFDEEFSVFSIDKANPLLDEIKEMEEKNSVFAFIHKGDLKNATYKGAKEIQEKINALQVQKIYFTTANSGTFQNVQPNDQNSVIGMNQVKDVIDYLQQHSIDEYNNERFNNDNC
ncbi:MAG: hypothetical protein HQM12_23910 [SAR324 cluster bacterium]|nr:hypothetical protein [SAR324 cluster bacterium]